MRNDLLLFHMRIESKMAGAFRQLHRQFQQSEEGIHAALQKIASEVSERDNIDTSARLSLIAGQNDIRQSLDSISKSFTQSLDANQQSTALTMKQLLAEQHAATESLLQVVSDRKDDAMQLQLESLVSMGQ
jgi:hypothetical protein